MALLIKVIQILLVIIFLSFLFTQEPPRNDFDKKFPYVSIFKSVVCENYNVTSYGYFRNCSIKAYSRNYTTLNFGYTLNTIMERPIFVKIMLMYRFGNIYREVYKTTVEICSILDHLESQRIFMTLIATVYKSLGNLLHKCPKSGSADFINITIDETETRNNVLYPEGFFKVCITILKPADKPIAKICPVFYTKSPLKDSFGRR